MGVATNPDAGQIRPGIAKRAPMRARMPASHLPRVRKSLRVKPIAAWYLEK
jgi:hypothetical protein